MPRTHGNMTVSMPLSLMDAFDKLAPTNQKSAIITQLIREWLRTSVGMAAIDTQVDLAQSKVDELKVSAEQYHEAQADLERLMSVQQMDSDVVKASEEIKEEKLQKLKLRNDIEEQLVKQRSDRAWLNLIGTELWGDGTPGYLLYHNEAKGDHTIIRYHPPTSEKDWGITDLHEIKKMTTRGDLPWIENCAEDCKKYKLKLWRGEGLPEYLMPFMQEKAGLVSCKPYAEDNIYFIKRIVEVDTLPDSHELSVLIPVNRGKTPSLEDK